MKFKQYVKKSLVCGDPFPYIIEQRGSLNRWYVEEGGKIVYTNTFTFEGRIISNIITSNPWTFETINPRFAPLFMVIPDFYLELKHGVFWAHSSSEDMSTVPWKIMTIELMEYLIKQKTWDQIPPLMFSKKQDVIPAKQPEFTDIFPTL